MASATQSQKRNKSGRFIREPKKIMSWKVTSCRLTMFWRRRGASQYDVWRQWTWSVADLPTPVTCKSGGFENKSRKTWRLGPQTWRFSKYVSNNKKSIICLRVFLFYLFSAPCCTLWQLFWLTLTLTPETLAHQCFTGMRLTFTLYPVFSHK